MKELNIKVKIVDREYSLRIDSKDEALLRAAGKSINNQVKQKKTKFGINDKQDLLAMVVFDNTVQSLRTNSETQFLFDKIESIDSLISEELD